LKENNPVIRLLVYLFGVNAFQERIFFQIMSVRLLQFLYRLFEQSGIHQPVKLSTSRIISVRGIIFSQNLSIEIIKIIIDQIFTVLTITIYNLFRFKQRRTKNDPIIRYRYIIYIKNRFIIFSKVIKFRNKFFCFPFKKIFWKIHTSEIECRESLNRISFQHIDIRIKIIGDKSSPIVITY